MLLCTLDITSLYTNTPHSEGVQAIKEFLAIHRDIIALPHNSYIIELLQVVLTNNYFDLKGKHYYQKSGNSHGHQIGTFICRLVYVQIWTGSCLRIPLTTHSMEKVHWWYLSDMATWHGFTTRIHSIFKHCTLHNQIHQCHLLIRNSISGSYNINHRW